MSGSASRLLPRLPPRTHDHAAIELLHLEHPALHPARRGHGGLGIRRCAATRFQAEFHGLLGIAGVDQVHVQAHHVRELLRMADEHGQIAICGRAIDGRGVRLGDGRALDQAAAQEEPEYHTRDQRGDIPPEPTPWRTVVVHEFDGRGCDTESIGIGISSIGIGISSIGIGIGIGIGRSRSSVLGPMVCQMYHPVASLMFRTFLHRPGYPAVHSTLCPTGDDLISSEPEILDHGPEEP